MATLREKTDFATDKDAYGKIGEERLLKMLASSNKTLVAYGVTDDDEENKAFQRFDIDAIQVKAENVSKQLIINWLKEGIDIDESMVTLYEVKTDTVGLESRNIVFEDISNGNPGCLARTKAHYIFYVFINDKSKEIREQYLLNTKELRWTLMREFSNVNKTNSNVKAKYMPRGKDNTALFLINIDWLLEKNGKAFKKIM